MAADAAGRAAVAAWRRALPDATAAELVVAFARAAGAPAAAITTFVDAVGVDAVPVVRTMPSVDVGIDPAFFLGMVSEVGTVRASRRRAGLFYTPEALARRVTTAALSSPPPLRVCDPTAGGGAFLLAAADALVGAGCPPADAVRALWGADVDPTAVEVARLALRWWAARHGVDDDPAGRVVVGDALGARPPWTGIDDGFDLVVGNPPFLSQLRGATVRDAARREVLVGRFGPAARGYVDDAALFLLAALDLVRPGGRVALIQPESVLTAAQAAPVRRLVEERAEVLGVWDPGEGWFDASVRVCVIELTARPGPALARGEGSPTWGRRLAAARGVPDVDPAQWHSGGRLDDVARVVSGFRDQYYGLVPAVTEEQRPEFPRLVTVGSVDLLRCDRARRPVRFARRVWDAPHVDLDHLGTRAPPVAAWVRDLLVPKVVVAPQGRMLLSAVDVDGSAVPSVPLISIIGRSDCAEPVTPWHLAAFLLAPPVTALVATEHAGSGLARDGLRVPGRALRTLPLPGDRSSWDVTADRVQSVAAIDDPARRAAALVALGPDLCAMYGLRADDLVSWWAERVRSTVRPLT